MNQTVHRMKLRSPFFEKVADGTKYIEVRLHDEKRQTIQLKDVIEFNNASNESTTVKTEVIGLLRYQNFEDLLNDFPLQAFGAEDETLFLQTLRTFYRKEEIAAYGVLGIRLNVLQR